MEKERRDISKEDKVPSQTRTSIKNESLVVTISNVGFLVPQLASKFMSKFENSLDSCKCHISSKESLDYSFPFLIGHFLKHFKER